MIQIMKITFRIWLYIVLIALIGVSVNYLVPMAINMNNDVLAFVVIIFIVPFATMLACFISYCTVMSVIKDIGKVLK